jgi:hypothetical protein
MKTIRKYVVNGGLFAGDGVTPAAVGDQVKLYLDTEAQSGFPDFIIGTVQHPVVPVNCDTAISYSFEYDEDDLLGVVAHLVLDDIISVEIYTAIDIVAAALDSETAARVAADLLRQPLNANLTAYAVSANASTATLAATVTTNANLTGPVTSVGNATAIANGALSIAKTSGLQAALDSKDPARKYLHGNQAITDALKTTLDAGLDAGFGIITDSTGNANDEWIYLAAADIAAAHPNHRVLYRLWNDTTKKYDLTTIQSGIGGDRHINFPTGSTFGYYMPASNMLETFAGNDLEIQAEFSLSTGHGSAYLILLSWGSGNGRGWLEMDPTTKVCNLNWSEDASGTTLRTATSTAGIPSFVLDQKYTVKATLDINDGSGNRVVKFWYSTNSGSTWTQLGSTITVATVTTTFWDGTNALLINSRGSAPVGGAKFYRVQIYKGIDGQPLLSERIDLWQRNTSGGGNTASLAGAPVLHIDNIANSGWGLNSHLTLQTAPQTAYIERGRLFWAISSSHNDTGMSFGEWGRKADELMAIVRTKSVDDPPIVLITQNPQNGVAVFKESHNNRCVQTLRVGSARGWPVIDANGVWRDYGDYSALINAADGIHPLAAGSQLTKTAILGALGY